MHPSVNYLAILIFVINYSNSKCTFTKHFSRYRLHERRHNKVTATPEEPHKQLSAESAKSNKITPNNNVMMFNDDTMPDETQQNAFISKNKNFFLKCPRSSDEHWHNKINFTVEWRRNGISYLIIRKRNQFPKFEITSRHLKHKKWIFKQTFGSKKSLSIQQWPNIDGQSASAIVYLDPHPKRRTNLNEKTNGSSQREYHYKFEAEERRQWFALRITRPSTRAGEARWECRVTVYARIVPTNDEKATGYESKIRLIQLESRKSLVEHPHHYHEREPVSETQKSTRRKIRMNTVNDRLLLTNDVETLDKHQTPAIRHGEIVIKQKNDYDEPYDDVPPIIKNESADELFSFSKSDGNMLTISRRKLPNEVAFTRNKENVEFTRANSDGAASDANNNLGESTGSDENEDKSMNYEPFGPASHKIVTLLAPPTSDGLFWKNWFQREIEESEFQNEIRSANEHRSFWWQSADNHSHSTRQSSTLFKFCSIFAGAVLQRIILNQFL